VAGTGFIVAPGLIATNRHVAEPWFGDREAAVALRHGATPVLEKLEAYFPGSPFPVVLETIVLAKHGDLAVLRMEPTAFTEKLRPLPLAPAPPMWVSRSACSRTPWELPVWSPVARRGLRALVVAPG
jgi:hypothetical protein